MAALATLAGAPAVHGQQPGPEWHGYVQLRYGSQDPSSGFLVRRAKLWMGGRVPGVDHLGYKVQGIFRNAASGAFVLQDVFAEYRRSGVTLRLGQFVPDFSLQRSQPDYLVPLIERARVVETMIPGARTLGREVGAEILLEPGSGWLHVAGGLFNGSGANHPPGTERDYLATGRIVLSRRLGDDARGRVGGSVAWRQTHGTDVGALTSVPDPFAGRDVRWGAEGRLWGERWAVQSEYLRADLDGETSHGFYLLGTLAIDAQHEVSLSAERLDARGAASPEGLWYVVGYAWYLQATPNGYPGVALRDARPTKLVTDLRAASDNGQFRARAAVQVQVFLR